MWMNEYDIEDAADRVTDETPNLKRAARIMSNLKDWTNENSDGWPYWQKPSKAATKLMDLMSTNRSGYLRPVVDISASDLKAALTPIKSFLTRQGIEHSKILS